MKYKAVIFDMDGVLIDSEFHWFEAEMNFLKKYGITMTREIMTKMTGRSLRETVSMIKEEYKLAAPIEELMGEKAAASEAIYEYKAQVMPGAHDLVKTIHAQSGRLAIASGSMLHRIEKIVQRFDLAHYFEHLVSSDHVNYVGKPDPAIYIYTANKLGLDPAHCVVIEDSVNGLKAAKGAGMDCIAVPDPRWSRGNYSEANLIVKGLTDEKIIDFLELN